MEPRSSEDPDDRIWHLYVLFASPDEANECLVQASGVLTGQPKDPMSYLRKASHNGKPQCLEVDIATHGAYKKTDLRQVGAIRHGLLENAQAVSLSENFTGTDLLWRAA